MANARLVEAGEIIADRAVELSQWSERIPRSIHVDALAGEVVEIVAGGPAAPHAITFEAPHAPYWKHPVFATGPRETWHWVAQIPPRRFMLPAAEEKADAAAEQYSLIVDDWAAKAGLT